jgi:hypothetical protein
LGEEPATMRPSVRRARRRTLRSRISPKRTTPRYGAVGQREEVEHRVRGQRDPGHGLAGADEIERRGRRGADEQVAAGQRQEGERVGLGHVGDLTHGVGGILRLKRDFLHLAVGAGADEEAVGAGGLEVPEDVAQLRAGQVGEDRAGQQAAVGAGGEAPEVAADDIAAEVDVLLLGERVGAETGEGHHEKHEIHEREGGTVGHEE